MKKNDQTEESRDLRKPNPSESLRSERLEHRIRTNELLDPQDGIRLGIDIEAERVFKHADRFRHTYVLGSSGSGKTNLFKNMIVTDMEDGKGLCVLAKETELVKEDTLPFVPHSRIDDVIFLNPKAKSPFCLNPLEIKPTDNVRARVESLTHILATIFDIEGKWTRPLFKNTLQALVPFPNTSFADFPQFLNKKDNGFRREVLAEVDNPYLIEFFEETFESHITPLFTESIKMRLQDVLQDPLLRRLFCGKTSFDLEEAMNDGAIVIVWLSDDQDVLGHDASRLLGKYLISQLAVATFNRSQISESDRVPFHVYIDEFDTFISDQQNVDAMLQLFVRARRFRVPLHLAHQDTELLPPKLLGKIIANAGTKIVFQVSDGDARRFTSSMLLKGDEGYYKLDPMDIVNQPVGTAWVRTHVGEGSRKEPYTTQVKMDQFTKDYNPDIVKLLFERSEFPNSATSDLADVSQDPPQAPEMDAEPPDARLGGKSTSEEYTKLWEQSEHDFMED